MGVPTSEVGYTIATTRRETTKVHKNMWRHWTKKSSQCALTTAVPSKDKPNVNTADSAYTAFIYGIVTQLSCYQNDADDLH